MKHIFLVSLWKKRVLFEENENWHNYLALKFTVFLASGSGLPLAPQSLWSQEKNSDETQSVA